MSTGDPAVLTNSFSYGVPVKAMGHGTAVEACPTSRRVPSRRRRSSATDPPAGAAHDDDDDDVGIVDFGP